MLTLTVKCKCNQTLNRNVNFNFYVQLEISFTKDLSDCIITWDDLSVSPCAEVKDNEILT